MGPRAPPASGVGGMTSKAERNRLSVSDSLKTHDVWQKSVGHDPYAGVEEGEPSGFPEVGEINSSSKGLFRLAQLTGNSSTLSPGACKRCGQVGHLFYQCRNNWKIGNSQPNPNEQFETRKTRRIHRATQLNLRTMTT